MYIPGLEFIVVRVGGKLIAMLYLNVQKRSPSEVVRKADQILAETKAEKARIEGLNVLSSSELNHLEFRIAR